jgi:triosephosphate isomerase (TIM)
MTRTPFIVGNWKMNTNRQEAVDLAAAIAAAPTSGVELAICPPFPWLVPVAEALAGSTVALGAQDCWTETKGAFTGAVSPAMLTGLCRYVIVGHSERRALFGDTDDRVAAKLIAALAADLHPILCVGESLETRRNDRAIAFVRAQVEYALSNLTSDEVVRLTIAYEPIWAIGTGVAAKPSDAEVMAAAIRQIVGELKGDQIAEDLRILYGGSVTATNAKSTLGQPNVDGALVGGASLQATSFLKIAAAAI